MYIEREVYKSLVNWKNSGEEPLLVEGARQVGKTYLVKKFAEDNFSTYLYIDMASNSGDSLLSLLNKHKSKNSNKEKTYNDFNEYFHDYKVNEIQRLYLSSEEIASKYLANLVSDILYNPKDIYDKLDKETRDKYSTYSEFEHLTVRIKTIKFLSAEVISYSSGVVDGKRAVYVIDKDDNKFVFIENSINNYKIRIN